MYHTVFRVKLSSFEFCTTENQSDSEIPLKIESFGCGKIMLLIASFESSIPRAERLQCMFLSTMM